MSHWRDLLMLNKLLAPVGNMRIFIRIRIRILNVVQSADPHYTHDREQHLFIGNGSSSGGCCDINWCCSWRTFASEARL